MDEVGIGASDDVRSVGPYCDELGINERVLLEIAEQREINWVKLSAVFVTNGLIMEMIVWLKDNKYGDRVVFRLLQALFDNVDLSNLERGNVRKRTERMLQKGTELKKSKKRGIEQEQKREEFERSVFPLPERDVEREGQGHRRRSRGGTGGTCPPLEFFWGGSSPPRFLKA